MFRRWETILGPEGLRSTGDTMDIAKVDADVIMTATVLGFTAGRLALGQPVEFTVDPTDGNAKLDTLKHAVKLINLALGEKYSFGGEAIAKFAPDWHKGALITGSPGGAKTPFGLRHAERLDWVSKKLHKLASAEDDDAIGYQGPGAYTGFVDDPIGHNPSIQSTMRYNVPSDSHGSRWCPPRFDYDKDKGERTEHNRAWGLLLGEPEVEGGMVQQPYTIDKDGNVVGYTHGMIQAVYDATQRGPWCTPFEIAVGKQTTKMASCFTCSIFMYAAGFPPSAIHLGQGASWVPFYELSPGSGSGSNGDNGTKDANALSGKYVPILDTVIGALNNRWRIECRQHLELGLKIMQQDNMIALANLLDREGYDAGSMHRIRTVRLAEFLAERADDIYAGANLILDAVTVHDGEIARITRTLRESRDVNPSPLERRLIEQARKQQDGTSK